jgi:hypothetical protein
MEAIMRNLTPGDRLAALAGLSAALAALAGFIPGLYRDPAPLVTQSHGQDLATLIVAVPLLAVALRASARGSLSGHLVGLGALGCLLYTYVTYAFDAVLNPATPLYIAVVGLASWSLFYAAPRLSEHEVESALKDRLPRRATGVLLVFVAVIFGLLWLGQMAQAAVTGTRPQALIEAGWPNNPIYVLDLAFVVPLCVATGVGLLTGRRRWPGTRFALPLLVFVALLALSILSLTGFAIAGGQSFEIVQVAIFVVATVVGATLAWLTLRPRSSGSGGVRQAATGHAREFQ